MAAENQERNGTAQRPLTIKPSHFYASIGGFVVGVVLMLVNDFVARLAGALLCAASNLIPLPGMEFRRPVRTSEALIAVAFVGTSLVIIGLGIFSVISPGYHPRAIYHANGLWEMSTWYKALILTCCLVAAAWQWWRFRKLRSRNAS